MPVKCKYVYPNKVKCKKEANYCYPGTTDRIFCYEHKEEGMITRKVGRTCQHESHGDSPKRATYNFPGKRIPIFCQEHKEDGMVNVKTQK
jgi:hypothetical protein